MSAFGRSAPHVHLEIALTGDDAVKRIGESAYDAVLCCVDRPEELTVISQLRKVHPAVSIVARTGSGDPDLEKRVVDVGAIALRPATESLDHFVSTLAQALETGQLSRQLAATVEKTHQLGQEIRDIAQKGRTPRLGHAPLLVEDDPDQAFLCVRAYLKAGIPGPVALAKDGEEAIAYLAGKGQFSDRRRFPLPSYVLLDLKLPKRSGFEVLEWIRNQPALSRLMVVILTSSDEPSDRQQASRLGANSYYVKPIRADELTELIQKIDEAWRLFKPGE